MLRADWDQVTAWRLDRHHLIDPAPSARWLSVISRIGGLHAQVMSAAEQALAIRVRGLPTDRVHRALWDDRQLVKTWAMRGTLHLIPRADFGDLVGAMSTLRRFLRPSWLRYFGLTAPGLDRLIAACAAELGADGLTREALATAVGRRTGDPALARSMRSGWGTLLKPMAFRGGLCFGPSRGQHVTFVRPDRWLGAIDIPESGRALAAVLRRYLAAYGPATPDEFSRWLGVEAAASKHLFRAVAAELVEVDVEGWRAWLLRSDRASFGRARTPRGARLLPYFDPYTVAMSKQAPKLFPAKHRLRVYRPQGWISPVILLDGRIVGVWERVKAKGRVEARLAPFGRLAAGERRAIADEAARQGMTLGR